LHQRQRIRALLAKESNEDHTISPARFLRDGVVPIYFVEIPDLSGKGLQSAFEAQCIPLEVGLLNVESYKAFHAKRREIVAVRINEFLGTSMPSPS